MTRVGVTGLVVLTLAAGAACGHPAAPAAPPVEISSSAPALDAAAPAPANGPDCPADVGGQPGNCAPQSRCHYPDGWCDCAGYIGGAPPEPDVDYSHWRCGRTRARADGCPDDLVAGAACAGAQPCLEAEGIFCGNLFTCTDGVWDGSRTTCGAIP